MSAVSSNGTQRLGFPTSEGQDEEALTIMVVVMNRVSLRPRLSGQPIMLGPEMMSALRLGNEKQWSLDGRTD